MDTTDILKKNLEQFVHIHVAEIFQHIKTSNPRLIDVSNEKKKLANELLKQNSCYFHYEDLENEYISILTEEIYKQAFKDFVSIERDIQKKESLISTHQ